MPLPYHTAFMKESESFLKNLACLLLRGRARVAPIHVTRRMQGNGLLSPFFFCTSAFLMVYQEVIQKHLEK